MHATTTPTLDEFETEVRTFFAGVPALLNSVNGGRHERARAYRAALFDAGLAGIGYPVEYGGRSLGSEYQKVFQRVATPVQPPEESTFGIGVGMALPTILEYGSSELKARLLPSGLRGEEIWCQLYSEPGAGSDLAGLTCKAERDGEEWIITGQKVWTSGAQHADLGILIARTDPDAPKHAGITMFVLPMNQPGVEVRPLVQMTGVAEFNEVFMDEARCPADWVVGEVNHGWRLATALLAHERTSLGKGQVTKHAERSKAGRFPIPFEGLLDRAEWANRRSDPVVRQQLAQAYIGEQIIPWLTARRQHPSISSCGAPSRVASLPTSLTNSAAARPWHGRKTTPRRTISPTTSSTAGVCRSAAVPTRSRRTHSANGSWGCRANPALTRTPRSASC